MPKIDLSSDGISLKASSHKEYHVIYVAQHADKNVQRAHVIGTLVGVVGTIAGLARADPIAAAGAAAIGAAIAWVSDIAIAKLKVPAFFKNPPYALLSNFKLVNEALRDPKALFKN